MSISSGPILSLNVTALPMSSSYTNESPNDSPSGTTRDDLGREGRTTDIGGKDTGVSYDKRLKDNSKAYLLKYTKTSDIRCISRQINQFMMEYNSRILIFSYGGGRPPAPPSLATRVHFWNLT